MVEDLFKAREIVYDGEKFNHIIQALENLSSVEIEEIIRSPLETRKYEKIKAALTKQSATEGKYKIKDLFPTWENTRKHQ